MNFDDVVEKLNILDDYFIERMSQIAMINSTPFDKQGTDGMAYYFSKIASKFGLYSEFYRQRFVGDCLCVYINDDVDSQPIILSGHSDTLMAKGEYPSNKIGLFNDKIYGPGVAECKGGLLAGLMAMVALKECGYRKRPIRLVFESEMNNCSSTSYKASINYLITKSNNAVAVLNCDYMEGNSCVLWRNGISKYEFDIFGNYVHTSNYKQAINPIIEACHKITELEKFKDSNNITFNCTMIGGGKTEDTIGDECVFTVESRYNTYEQMLKSDRIINEIAQTSFIEGTRCTVERKTYRHPMEKYDRNFELLGKVNMILNKYQLPSLSARGSVYGSDAGEISHAGLPCIDSVGIKGFNVGTADEYIEVSELKEAAIRLAAIIYEI